MTNTSTFLLHDSVINKHTVYSASKTYKTKLSKENELEIFNFEKFEYLGFEDSLKIVSLNCCRFPYSSLACNYLANILYYLNADIYLLQEIKSLSHLKYVISFLNFILEKRKYVMMHSKTRFQQFNTLFVVDFNSIKFECFKEIYPAAFLKQPLRLRPPISIKFLYFEEKFELIEVHAPPYRSNNYQKKKTKFFNLLNSYIFSINPDFNVITGGDFNTYPRFTEPFFTVYPSYVPDNNFRSELDYFYFQSKRNTFEYKYHANQLRTDYIFYKSKYFADYRNVFSDHFPVIFLLSKKNNLT